MPTIGESSRLWTVSRLDLGLLTTKSACCLHEMNQAIDQKTCIYLQSHAQKKLAIRALDIRRGLHGVLKQLRTMVRLLCLEDLQRN